MRERLLLRALVPAVLVAVAVLLLRAGASGTVVPEADLTGRWNVLMLGGAFTTACDMQFTQNGSDVDGDWICEPGLEFTGTIKDDDSAVELILDGSIGPNVIHIEATVSQDENSLDGTWETAGFEGDFSADRKLSTTATPTPTRTGTPTRTPTPALTTATPLPTTTPVPTVGVVTPTPTPTVGDSFKTGDANCDDIVNSIDATLTLQLVALLIEALACDDLADVNFDGVVNSVDAALILQYVAGLIDSF